MTELVAVVTGGASGIGAAIADRLASSGARVAVLDRGSTDASGTHLGVLADVTDDASVRSAIARVADESGRIDIVVNNASVGASGTVEENDDAEWARVFDVNVIGMTRAALPSLRESRAAAIVNMCSIAATAGLPQRALYSATKGAVLALTRAMAADHLSEGRRVNAVCPGTADTPWVDRLLSATDDPESERAALRARQPHGRLVSANEVAEAVAYLVDPRNGSTTGVSIAVDGGMQELRVRPTGRTAAGVLGDASIRRRFVIRSADGSPSREITPRRQPLAAGHRCRGRSRRRERRVRL